MQSIDAIQSWPMRDAQKYMAFWYERAVDEPKKKTSVK
jgi:hypothetical protein